MAVSSALIVYQKLKITIMKKLVFLAIAAMLSIGAFAQTPTTSSSDKKQDMKDLRKDIKDVRKDKKERKEDLKEGDKAGAKEETKDIRADKKDIKADAKDLKKDGVKHPIRRAKRQIHK